MGTGGSHSVLTALIGKIHLDITADEGIREGFKGG